MIEKIKLFVAKILLHKYLPIQYLVKAWTSLSGYRTQICAVLWVAAYEMGKYKVGAFADPTFTNQSLQWLGGIGSATLIEKFKGWLPYVEQGIDAVKTQG